MGAKYFSEVMCEQELEIGEKMAPNSLVVRASFTKIKDSNGKPVFSLFFLIFFSILYTERDGFNRL